MFPSRRVYHVLIDAFIREGDAAGGLLYSMTIPPSLPHSPFPSLPHSLPLSLPPSLGAIAAHEQMLEDEVDPDRMTFHLAAVAHVLLVTIATPTPPQY